MTQGLLQDRLVLITGASRGIGQAIGVACAKAGARVVATDHPSLNCEATLVAIRAQGGQAWSYGLDVTQPEACAALAQQVAREVGQVDTLVNNAGVIIREGIDSPRAQESIHKVFDVNLFGVFNTIQAFLPHLRHTRGCIVNIASGAALHGQPNAVGYSASKGAVKLLTQSMAADLSKDGIRVNAVAPGVIVTPMTEATRANPERLERFVARIPCGRLGQPEEIAGPVVFLASPMASYVNGTMLSADGGYSAV
ncbi:MAG: glucose 1-dehydrogenase [Betaproteobacteria bacterium]|jgi:meso-butanediol dehydrogenase / (S,S)-butanediol dehydrogenase / diacetyl reductase|nr:glucose 1-dehydrogenase [Betaproteobacteria bacterium]NBP45174.1 glucose 1-dehydrogenase [Betaproteobacteria bacterium]